MSTVAPVSLTPRQPFGSDALALVKSALERGNLSSVGGPLTRRLEDEFATFYGSRHAVASSSGTAAIHTAVAALGLAPGSEVIVAPITDAGSVTPLLYEGLIPTFCDVDEHLAMTPETVRAALTERTRAIMVVHTFGGVCDVAALRELADEHDLWLLEDCSQAHGTALGERYVGTYGHIGMFSLQSTKHMTSGDGGLAITDSDDLAAQMRLFRDKGWDRSTHGARSYPRLGLNYRITELQSAVALPQLATLPEVVDSRRAIAARLDAILDRIDDATVWSPPPGGESSYWCYPFFVSPDRRDAIAAYLGARGVPATPGYIGAPIFECLTATSTRMPFGHSGYPYSLAPDVAPDPAVPGARRALDRVVVVWIHEHLTDEDVDAIGEVITEAVHSA